MAFFMNVSSEKECLFVPSLDKEAAVKESNISNIQAISGEEDTFEVINKNLHYLSDTVGVEGKVISYNRTIDFKKNYLGIQLEDIQPTLSNIRLKKIVV